MNAIYRNGDKRVILQALAELESKNVVTLLTLADPQCARNNIALLLRRSSFTGYWVAQVPNYGVCIRKQETMRPRQKRLTKHAP